MALTPRGAKQKGANYERELARFFNTEMAEEFGVEAQRALLSGGGRSIGGTDVDGVPELHVEAKRVEALSFREAIRQAETAVSKKRVKDVPVVITRKNHEETHDSIVMIRLREFMPMYRAWLRGRRQAPLG